MMNVAICVSGGGTNLEAMLRAKARGELVEANFALVIASRHNTPAETKAITAGIPTVVLSRKSYTNQADYDRAFIEALKSYDIDLIVLAGFLTRLGDDLVSAYQGRIINVHPSLLPQFGGQGYYGIKPHEAVLEAGLQWTGATVHLVTSEYDKGPILMQRKVAVLPEDNAKTLQKRVMREAEQIILPQVVDLITKGRLDTNIRKRNEESQELDK